MRRAMTPSTAVSQIMRYTHFEHLCRCFPDLNCMSREHSCGSICSCIAASCLLVQAQPTDGGDAAAGGAAAEAIDAEAIKAKKAALAKKKAAAAKKTASGAAAAAAAEAAKARAKAGKGKDKTRYNEMPTR